MIDKNEILSKLKYFISTNRQNTNYKIWDINSDVLCTLCTNNVYPFSHKFLESTDRSYLNLDYHNLYCYMIDLINKNSIDIIDVFYSILLTHHNKKILISTYDNIYVYVFINQKDVLVYNLSDPDDGMLLYTRSESSYSIPLFHMLLLKGTLKKIHQEKLLPYNSIYIKKSNFLKKYNIFNNTEYSMLLSILYIFSKMNLAFKNSHIIFDNYKSTCTGLLYDIYYLYRIISRENRFNSDLNISNIQHFDVINNTDVVLKDLYKDKEDLLKILNIRTNFYDLETEKTYNIKE